MDSSRLIQDFQQRVLDMIRASPAADIERNVKALMSQTFSRMDLVTREDFETQVELLAALRERVQALESRLDVESTRSPQAEGPAANAGQG